MRRFIVGDTHLFHKRIIEYCNRPENFTELLINNLQAIIKPEDILYHLGDVHFGRREQLKEILNSIPGKKVLLRGSHDHWSEGVYHDCGFSSIVDILVVKRIILSHEPVSVPEWADYNIHGHHHTSFGATLQEYVTATIDDTQHCFYTPEYFNYRPIEVYSLLSCYRKLRKSKEINDTV